jgi:hypothetical protein
MEGSRGSTEMDPRRRRRDRRGATRSFSRQRLEALHRRVLVKEPLRMTWSLQPELRHRETLIVHAPGRGMDSFCGRCLKPHGSSRDRRHRRHPLAPSREFPHGTGRDEPSCRLGTESRARPEPWRGAGVAGSDRSGQKQHAPVHGSRSKANGCVRAVCGSCPSSSWRASFVL